MQRKNTWKLATGLMVMLLLATPFVVMALPASSAATSANVISINVFDQDSGLPIQGASATLTEVHKMDIDYTDTSDSAGLLEFTPQQGYYKLAISKSGYYDYVYSDVIRFDGLSSKNLGIALMKAMPSTTQDVTVHVQTAGAVPVVGATVIVNETYNGITQTVAVGTTNATGNATLSLHAANYTVIVKKTSSETNVSALTVAGASVVHNVTLASAIVYSGTVTVNGSPAANANVYLIDKADPLSSPDKKIIAASVASNYFRFDAYAGSFYLIVDADGAMAKVQNVTLSGSSAPVSIDLASQDLQEEINSFEFLFGDWNTVEMTKIMDMDFDMSIPGLDYYYLPNLRMQIDLAIGNGDGNVNASEVVELADILRTFGPVDVTTSGMMTVAGNVFVSSVDDPAITLIGLTGAVDSTDGVEIQTMTDYAPLSTITNALDSYEVKVYPTYDTASMHYYYALALPDDGSTIYEMVSNVTNPSTLTVLGYTVVSVDSAVKRTGDVTTPYATLSVQKSVAPTALAGIVTGPTAYAVMNGSVLQYYIVANDTNVTFTGIGSSDPNGNPLTYTWTFGDGSSATVSTVTTVYKYTEAIFNRTVTLTVTDVAGLTAQKTFYLKVDSIAPVVKVSRNGTEVSSINVDQNAALVLSSSLSVDYINETADAYKGLIASYKWNWGDGNTTTVLMGENQTVTHAYTVAGTYTLYLNVTDVANHTSSKAVSVIVKDVVPPTVKITVRYNGTDVSGSSIENYTLTFDPTGSTDVSGIASYFWEFGDGTNSSEEMPTHFYNHIKTYTVRLTLTDNAGNTANKTYTLNIQSGDRPDVRVGAVTFEPAKFIEGENGYIYINVTNVGSAKAEGILSEMFKLNIDGTKESLSTQAVLLVNGTEKEFLDIGESGKIRMQYSFATRGTYTLQFTVMANNETGGATSDNTVTASLTVDEAGWKPLLLYGGIFAVIIVVIALFYMRKKLPFVGGSKKGSSGGRSKK